MNNLYESILSDVDTGLDNMDKAITSVKIIKKLKKLCNYIPAGDGVDCYGRKLNIGDIIMYPNAASIYFGIIIEFTDEGHWCLVASEGDPDGHCDKVYCEETFKITEKQFLELTKDIR
jgi:hypothetical protein